jgi:hypothetical protein
MLTNIIYTVSTEIYFRVFASLSVSVLWNCKSCSSVVSDYACWILFTVLSPRQYIGSVSGQAVRLLLMYSKRF